MPGKFRIVQPYRAEVRLFKGDIHQVSAEAVHWESSEPPMEYPADVIDDYLLEAPIQPFAEDKNIIYPSDILKVQHRRSLRLGRFTIKSWWATVYERAPSEFREVHSSNDLNLVRLPD